MTPSPSAAPLIATLQGSPLLFALPKSPASRWKKAPSPELRDRDLGGRCGISPVLATILRARGHDSIPAVEEFLLSGASALLDPRGLPDMDKAVARLHRAIVDKEPILVCGDYDVDGLTSTAMLWRSLRNLGANVSARVPERSEGYDLKIPDVEKAHRDGFTLILTADNGIRAIEAVERARELNIEVIITDHHEPGDVLPSAFAIVNPKREDSAYGFRELCGCGVAFKLMQALLETHWPRHLDAFTDKFIDLVAIATVADCVRLEGENRVLARMGLKRLAHTKKRGLQALMESARLKVGEDGLRGSQVGFGLAPRLNAAGRVARAEDGLRLLMSTDEDECRDLAELLEGHNRTRQSWTARVMDEALAFIDGRIDLNSERALVVQGGAWGHGIVGLVASRLVESYSRPAIVFGIEHGVAIGSGRSIEAFDLGRILDATRDLLLRGGGHHMACGMSVEEGNLGAFRARVAECAGEHLQMTDLVPVVEADCLVRGGDVSAQMVDDLSKLEPCGTGNREPVLMMRGARILNERPMTGGEHMKWNLSADGFEFEAVWFKCREKARGLGSGSAVDLCFVPEWNTYRDQTTLQLKIKDARAASDEFI